MSGFIGAQIQNVNNDVLPREGSRLIKIPIVWQNNQNNPPWLANINLTSQAMTNQFTALQSVYVDNSTCPWVVILQSLENGSTIRINPFASGMYPVICGQNPSFTATLCYTDNLPGNLSSPIPYNVSTTFYFLNTPEHPYLAPGNVYGLGGFNQGGNFIFTPTTSGFANAQLVTSINWPASQKFGLNSYTVSVALTNVTDGTTLAFDYLTQIFVYEAAATAIGTPIVDFAFATYKAQLGQTGDTVVLTGSWVPPTFQSPSATGNNIYIACTVAPPTKFQVFTSILLGGAFYPFS